MSLVNTLNWRYAVKKFNSEKSISEEQVTDLLKGMNLAPSSFGIQPYEFIVVSDKKIKQELLEHSYNQSQVVDASHLIVIAARKDISQEYVDDFITRTAETRTIPTENLDGYKKTIMGFVEGKDSQEILQWTQKQCYTVLGVLMSLCADMHIDSCPMEGFNPEKYNEILGLNKKNLHTTLIIPIGYRASDDEYADFKKIRHHLDEITTLHY
jgi:nitroreductase